MICEARYVAQLLGLATWLALTAAGCAVTHKAPGDGCAGSHECGGAGACEQSRCIDGVCAIVPDPTCSRDASTEQPDGGSVECTPQPEDCNTSDDDCDGRVDEDFDLARDPLSCGACDRACEPGEMCTDGHCDHDIVEIDAGLFHACARRMSGEVMCWGRNGDGELGVGVASPTEPPTAVTGLDDATAISAGHTHTCAIRANGEIVCWGLNGSGQLGDGSTLTRPAPVTVQGVRDATHVSAGWLYSCAAVEGGRVLCWGADGAGQLGDGPTDSSGLGAVEVAGVTDAIAVSAGQTHACALRATGEVLCWGDNSAHQCSDGTATAHPAPVAVLGISDAVQIAAGTGHTCAVGADGLARCWGANGFRELGDGTNDARTMPVQVIYSNDVVEVGAGGAAWAGAFFGFSCARQSDGTVKCWGLDDLGQLGALDGPPGAVVVGLDSATRISLGAKYACALQREGDVWCWGINEAGELGDGTTTSRGMAAPIVGL